MREFIIWNYNLTLNLIPDKKVEAISQIYKTLTIKSKDKLTLYFSFYIFERFKVWTFKRKKRVKN